MPKKILLTGFGEFSGAADANPSRLLVEQAATWTIPNVVLTTTVFPVKYVAGERQLFQLLTEYSWDAVLCLGVLGPNTALHIETIAQNLDNAVTPSGKQVADMTGDVRINRIIRHFGAPQYASRLPISKIMSELAAQGIPAVESTMGGGNYVCNHIQYVLLYTLKLMQRRIPAGFIHVPLKTTPETVKGIQVVLQLLGSM